MTPKNARSIPKNRFYVLPRANCPVAKRELPRIVSSIHIPRVVITLTALVCFKIQFVVLWEAQH